MNLSPQLQALSDTASSAHARIQSQHPDINPVIGIRQSMRQHGVPADVITLDDLKSGKRIVLILHDQQPGTLMVQFTEIEAIHDAPYDGHPLDSVTSDTLYHWMRTHFSA